MSALAAEPAAEPPAPAALETGPIGAAASAPAVRPVLEAVGITKRFGAFTALGDVTVSLYPGEVHALLGENGAGKSTLVKAIMGYHRPDEGAIVVGDKECEIANPRDAMRLGIGMVYQHFTLVPSMTVLENLVMARADVAAFIGWKAERARLLAFLDVMPLRVPIDTPVDRMSAGERQKTEILKQLYLQSRILILDEPTSVLTPDEADEVLGFLKTLCREQGLSVLLITHKFREVTTYCDRVSVLRRGRFAGTGRVDDLSTGAMAAMMIGEASLPTIAKRDGAPDLARPVLDIGDLKAGAAGERGAIDIARLTVHAGEIVGIAGISGNGQKTLVEVLGGQRPAKTGRMAVSGRPYGATRAEAQARKVRCLPEEPLRNACAPRMSVAENLAFRTFDRAETGGRRTLLDKRGMAVNAAALIDGYGIKTRSPASEIRTLSGGNVQRAVLARELSGDTDLLVAANPCFGLDFAAVASIRSAIVAARNKGAAVLLVSEDLDEIVALSDRILVMCDGRIVFETAGGAGADLHEIGGHMAGHA